MADALCGPSNALQSFQKHTSVDRTLQQDRLTGPRHSPAQGFRSFDPRAGSLDAEFHAFENAPINPFRLEQPIWRLNVASPFPAQPSLDWANDFQNLRLGNSPLPAHQFRTEAPLIRSAPGDWQQEFIRQRENVASSSRQKEPEIAPQVNFEPSYMAQSGALSSMHQAYVGSSQQIAAQGTQFDEAAFEQAFRDVFNEVQAALPPESLQQNTELQAELVEEHVPQEIHEPGHAKIGSDAIQYIETADRSADHDAQSASDLARVAGELIHNVSHETNDKFKNSQFLNLMRHIRDREIEVRNNDFEFTIRQETHAAPTQSEPEQLRPHDPNTFEFPDMNDVYKVDGPLDMTPDYTEYHPANPRNQISDLHPGGPLYPEQSPRPERTHMSGAINDSLSADETNPYAAA